MLIFLDIDGVMLPSAGWKTFENLSDNFPAFNPSAVKALNLLLSKYEKTTVVLTTSHRHRFSFQQWREIFKNRGIEIARISCLESNESLKTRKEEILNWFDTYDIFEDFIIIDDDTSLHGLSNETKKRLIVTSPLIGLTPELIDHL